jgi:CheY-like chemotaxis protein
LFFTSVLDLGYAPESVGTVAAARARAVPFEPGDASVRVLLLEDGPIEALAIQRDLASRHDVRVVPTLAEALAALTSGAWRPDVVLADLSPHDTEAVRVLETLQAAAGTIPVVVSVGGVTEALRRHLDALGAATAAPFHDRGGGLSLLKAILGHQQLLQYNAGPPQQRADLAAEIDRAARQAADAAALRAVDQLIDRLGLDDEEGLRMAIRLARGWEAAKSRFLSAVATGIGSAFLLALGAGLVAMLRQNAGR